MKIFAYPGYLIGSEISKLVNKGYQQFLKTAKTEVPATADHLKALQQFTEELKEGLGLPTLYNESLGTVSESYHYDRIENRDKPERRTGPSVPGKRRELWLWPLRKRAGRSLHRVTRRAKSQLAFSSPGW